MGIYKQIKNANEHTKHKLMAKYIKKTLGPTGLYELVLRGSCAQRKLPMYSL